MDKPKINTSTLYGTVARLMPQEGRDFTIDSAYDEAGKAKLVITPVTAIGRAWVPFLQTELENPMKEDGVTISTAGKVAAETVTINSIRAKIEAEAFESLKAKIKAAEDDHKSKHEAAVAIRKEQVAKEGDVPPNEAVRTANRASNDAGIEEFRLKKIAAKIPTMRTEVEDLARAAAKKDMAEGKDWSVDLNAPLTSLFDHQDVEQRFRSKESLLLKMATMSVELDDMRDSAVYNAKQYILQKGE